MKHLLTVVLLVILCCGILTWTTWRQQRPRPHVEESKGGAGSTIAETGVEGGSVHLQAVAEEASSPHVQDDVGDENLWAEGIFAEYLDLLNSGDESPEVLSRLHELMDAIAALPDKRRARDLLLELASCHGESLVHQQLCVYAGKLYQSFCLEDPALFTEGRQLLRTVTEPRAANILAQATKLGLLEGQLEGVSEDLLVASSKASDRLLRLQLVSTIVATDDPDLIVTCLDNELQTPQDDNGWSGPLLAMRCYESQIRYERQVERNGESADRPSEEPIWDSMVRFVRRPDLTLTQWRHAWAFFKTNFPDRTKSVLDLVQPRDSDVLADVEFRRELARVQSTRPK